jgi:methionyl-tRNA formyltransferase
MAERFSFAFFSTDDFSLPTLDRLLDLGECVAVVTTPARPKGRGKKVSPNPIDSHAKKLGLDVIYTDRPKDPGLQKRLAILKPDFIITLSFPFIIPVQVLNIPRWAVNIHPSLLPRYRGPAPIRWAILNGEKRTGITTIIMNERVDAGMIVYQVETEIRSDENYGELRARLSEIAPSVTTRTVESLLNGSVDLKQQDEVEVTYAPKLTKDMLEIDWSKEGEVIVNLVRALAPEPGARTSYAGQMIKVLKAMRSDHTLPPGLIKVVGDSLYVGSKTEAISIMELKPAGRKVISSKDFINGYHPDGKFFGRIGG